MLSRGTGERILLAAAALLVAATTHAAPLFHKTITINPGQVTGGPLTNYPFLFNTTDPALRTTANGGRVTNANGWDIIFATSPTCADSTSCGGAKLDHEIERYNPVTGQLVAWVRVPSIDNGTVFFIHYGDSAVGSSTENRTAVWDVNYQAVWHLSEAPANGTSGGHIDSKHNTAAGALFNNGTPQGFTAAPSSTNAPGIAAVADRFYRPFAASNAANDDVILVPDHATLEPAADMTLETWVNASTLPAPNSGNLHVLAQKNRSTPPFNSYQLYFVGDPGATRLSFGWVNTTPFEYNAYNAGPFSTGTWYHVAGVLSGSTVTLYVNGSAAGTTPGTKTGTLLNTAQTLSIGNGDGVANGADGILDEVRLSNSARSAGWLLTQYRNVSSPSTFYSLSPSLNMLVKSGYYQGNATAGRPIYVGFQPDAVFVKRVGPPTDINAVLRTSTMTSDNTKSLDNAGLAFAPNLVQSLTTDGFTVGSDVAVNENLRDYYWVAFRAADGEMKVGSYLGDGLDNRSIPGVGFPPDYVITLPPGAGSPNGMPLWVSSTLPPDSTFDFDATQWGPNSIQALQPNGFQVGSNPNVNAAGVTFHYVAWKAVPGRMAVGTYTGDGADNRNLDVAGFFPEWVVIKKFPDAPLERAVTHKPASTGVNADIGLRFAEIPTLPNTIQALRPLGFQVGSDERVNFNDTSVTGCNGPCTYHWIAFGPHEPSVNYRSIGTALNYTTGTVAVTNGSSVVTGTGTAWVTANRGRGDRILISGVNYTIRAVSSQTQLTLTAPYAGATASGLGYTIARQFTTLQAWEDCISFGAVCAFFPVATASLVADDRREVGIAYKDSVFALTAPVDIQGSTTDATHTITLTADPGNRHNGTPGAGVLVDGQDAPNEILVEDDNVTVEWLEIVRIRNGASLGQIRVLANTVADTALNVLLQNLLIHNFIDAANTVAGIRLSGAVGKGVTVRNSMIWDGDRYGIAADEPGDTLVVENCSIDQMQEWGVNTQLTTGVTVRNTIATSNATADFGTAGGSLTGSNNTSSDASASTFFTNPQTAAASALFVLPNANLHLKSGANLAVNTGLDLSPGFFVDVDGNVRPAVAWDRGADERDVTTAVELMSYSATGLEGAVGLSWTTASELHNLGFHLYRSDTPEGPYARLTSSLIPGLGSSPTGQSYAYRDSGLVNGRTYYYELEDVETTGGTKRHGPVSAMPTAGSGGSLPPNPAASPSRTSYGDPTLVTLREVERSPQHVVLELVTGGFWASAAEEGHVRLSIPGFESASRPGEPELPMRRALVAAAAGKRVRLASVVASDDVRFPGLRPVSQGMPGIEVSEEGTVLTSEEKRREGRAFGGPFPVESALLFGVSFQEETKKAEVQFFPLRWEGSGLTLSRRLLVRLEFAGTERQETSRGGSQGRRRAERASHAQSGVVAQVVVKDKGLQGVDYEEVFGVEPGRRERGLPESSLRLSRQGRSVALHVEPPGALFGPGSSLYFLSEGPDLNPYGDAVYELETNTSNRGLRMGAESLSSASGTVSEYFPALPREENHYYQAGLLEAPDLWLWDVVVSPGSKSFPFMVTDLAPSSSVGRLSVVMQGASDFEGVTDHHVRVRVNGVMVGEAIWDGRLPQGLDAEVGAGILHEGENSLELEDVGDSGAAYSMVFLNRFSVSYPRRLVASQGKLEGRFESTGQAEIEGASASSFVLDTTGVPRWLTGASATPSGLTFPVEAGRSYLVTSSVLRPTVKRLPPSGLKSSTNRADYLLLAPQAFLPVAQPLLDLRESQGLVTKAVSLEEIYEQFGHGEVSPEAIKEFLEYAYHFWASPSPRYVLLLGDASYDPKDNLQTGVKDWLPGFPVRTSYLWTVSDPAYASVNGEDLLPDLAIGRLPAGSVDEAQRLVQKTLGYENGGGRLDGPAVLVADNADQAGNFEADADDIASTLLASRNPTKIYYSQEGASTRTKIEEAFDAGASLMSYVGHGGTAVWASENIFNYQDVQTLSPQPRQPLLITLNCLNGFFHFPPLNSLSEELLKAEGKGVIGAFSPSGLSVNDAAHLFHKALLEEIVSGRHERIGDAILAAQERYAASGAFPELLSIYNLLGDPALALR